MKLDVRFPMGLLFSILGVLLLVYGAAADSTAHAAHRYAGANINIICGSAFLLFGLAMLALVKRARKK
jgi:threonine/homoserine/homoserine lactone efflux protein